MGLLHISELAERSGVPSSTLRYYERIGLVAPLGRADNGYRVYDEASVERLEFIARAKRLGMTLDDVATLVEAWFAGDCQPLQDRLREFVTGRIDELRTKIAEDSAFERQLERVLIRLGEGTARPERCGPDCGCDTDPLEGPESMACSLDDSDARQRVEEWHQILARASRRHHFDGGVRIVFDPSAAVIAELARLCAAETACCPFFDFGLDVTARATILTIKGPAGADDLISRFFEFSSEVSLPVEAPGLSN
jgi:DNA-binding transcriptional MerR regulator